MNPAPIHWFADLIWLIVGINLFVIIVACIRYLRSKPEPVSLEQHLEDLEQQAYLSRLKRVA